MRDIVNAPIFLRLGARMRSPEGTPIGTMKRIPVSYTHLDVYKRQAWHILGSRINLSLPTDGVKKERPPFKGVQFSPS